MQKIVLLFLVAASSLFGVEKNSMDCSNTPDWLMSEADKKYLCKDKNKVSKAKSDTAKSTQTGMVHSLDPNGDGFLSLRSKPKGRELGRLYNGDKVTILDTRGKWYKVKTSDGQVGYAHSNWIRKTSSTATASNSSSSKTGVVTGLDPNGDGFLALRSKPKGREIGKLYNGDKVTILDKRGKWYKVKTASAGQIGWAHGNWVRQIREEKTEYTAYVKRKKEILEEIKSIGLDEIISNHEAVISYYKEKLPSKYKKDRDIIVELVSRDPRVFQYIDPSFRKDKKIARSCIRMGFWDQMKYADPSLKKDKSFMLPIIKENRFMVKYADQSLRKDKDIMLATINDSDILIEYADRSLRNDIDFMAPLIKRNPQLLSYAGMALKKDKAIVLDAVKKDGKLLEYADISLRKDKDVVLAAVNKDAYILKYADPSLQKDKDIMLAVNSQRDHPFSYAIKHNDLELMKYMIKKYENECNDGKSKSCKILGSIYLFGALGKVDIKKASMYYKKANIQNNLISLMDSDNYKLINDFNDSHFYTIKKCEKVYAYKGYESTVIQVKPDLDIAIEYNMQCDENNTVIGLRLKDDYEKSWFKVHKAKDHKIYNVLKNHTYYQLNKDSLVGYISEAYKEQLTKQLKDVRKNLHRASDSEKEMLSIAEQMLSEKGLVFPKVKQIDTLVKILQNPTIYLYDINGYEMKMNAY